MMIARMSFMSISVYVHLILILKRYIVLEIHRIIFELRIFDKTQLCLSV